MGVEIKRHAAVIIPQWLNIVVVTLEKYLLVSQLPPQQNTTFDPAAGKDPSAYDNAETVVTGKSPNVADPCVII